MPRFLRRNIALRGVQTSGASGRGLGRTTPATASTSLIVPQCIAWPFATDMYGETMPSGIVAVRSAGQARQTTERNWATAGDPTQNLDRWIAVPDTLPGAYTSRPTRDANKGQVGVSGGRGTPYFDVTFGGSIFTDDGSNVMNNRFGVATEIGGAAYRPSGGGGLVANAWYPMNVSDRVPRRVRTDNLISASLNPATATYIDNLPGTSSATGITIQNTMSKALGLYNLQVIVRSFWLPQHVGWRRLKIRISALTTAAWWSSVDLATSDVQAQVCIRHNVDGSVTPAGYGDTQDYLSSIVDRSGFSSGPSGPWWGSTLLPRYVDFDLTSADFGLPTKAGGIRATQVVIGFKGMRRTTGGPVDAWFSPWGTPSDTDPLNHDYDAQLWAWPRVDVPLWFSAYGAGVGAPGGV